MKGSEAAAGRPVTASAGRAMRPLACICAAMASFGRASALTTAFQPAWRTALVRAAATLRASMPQPSLRWKNTVSQNPPCGSSA